MRSLLVLLAVVCVAAPASIIEDLNPRGLTFLYEVQSGRVVRWRCEFGASVELKRETCQRAGSPVAVDPFLHEVRRAFATRAAELSRREGELAAEKRRLEENLAEWRDEITRREHESPKPLEALSALAGRYRAAEARLEAIAAESRTLATDREGAEKVASGRLLGDTTMHAFSASRAIPGAAAVELLAQAFETAGSPSPTSPPVAPPAPLPQPTRRITQSWRDPGTGRLWYLDPLPRSYPEARLACPAGYGLLTAAGYMREMLAALARLKAAWEAGQTGYGQRPDDFWGWEVPPQLSGVRFQTAYRYRPWSPTPIQQDYLSARHAVMCVSLNAVPNF